MRCNTTNIDKQIWTGRAIIEENKIIIRGKNLLGNIWMELRNYIK